MAKGTSRAKPSSHRRGKRQEYLYEKGPVTAAAIRIHRGAGRDGKMAVRLKSYGLPDVGQKAGGPSPADAARHMQDAVRSKKLAIECLKNTPKNWKPTRGTLGATPLAEDTKVLVRPQFVNRYAGVFDTRKPLRVASNDGPRIICEAKYQGETVRVPMPRSHIQPA